MIVEDGTGKADANSYSDVASADAYFAERGNTVWAGLTEQNKEFKLVQATDYIEGRFADKWRGQPLTDTQALAWPRSGVGTPFPAATLARATAEYAVRLASGSLVYEETISTDGALKRKKTQTGPIITDKEYFGPGQTSAYKAVPGVDYLFSSLTWGSGNEGGVIRA